MKVKAWKQKIISMILMLVILTLNGSAVMAEDDKKKEKDYNIQNTTDGKYNDNGSLSVTLKVESNKKDFNGTIKLYVGNTEWSDYASTAYEKPISIEKGKSKEIVFDVGYSSETTGKLWYELIDENGEVVYDQEGSLAFQYSGVQLNMGVLTDDFSNFAFLNEGGALSLEIWGERVGFSIEELNESNFPESNSEMEGYDYLFIDQFYTDKLSETQMDVLLQWVRGGGMVFIGTGANAVDTLSGFDTTDLGVQPGSIAEEKTVLLTEQAADRFMNSMCGYMLAKEDQSATVTCCYLTYDSNFGAYFSSDVTDPGYVMREYGSGYVFVFPFSFTETNMPANMKKAVLGASSMNYESDRVVNKISSGYMYYSNYELKNAQSLLNDIKIPGAVMYLLLFVVYMVIATFVTYLVLKKKDKREYIWMAIPAWSILFTLVVLVISRDSRVTKPIESSVTVVELGENQKTSTSFIALTTPNMKGYELSFNPKLKNVVATIDSSGMNWNDKEDIRASVDYTLKEDADGYSMSVEKAKTFEYKYLQGVQTENSEEKIDVTVEEDGLFCKGTVTNRTNYDLIGVVVQLNGVSYNIGNLKKGETKEFTEEENGNYYYNLTYETEDKLERNRMNALLNLCADITYGSSYLNQFVDSDNVVLGIVRDYDVNLIKNEDFKEFNTAIYTQKLNTSELGIRVEYNLDDYVQTYAGDYDNMDGQLYEDQVDIFYNVKGMDDICYAVNWGSKAVDYLTPCKVSFYNVKTGQYDVVFQDKKIVNLEDYISEEKEIKVKYEREGTLLKDTYDYGVPYIYVFGGEENVEN